MSDSRKEMDETKAENPKSAESMCRIFIVSLFKPDITLSWEPKSYLNDYENNIYKFVSNHRDALTEITKYLSKFNDVCLKNSLQIPQSKSDNNNESLYYGNIIRNLFYPSIPFFNVNPDQNIKAYLNCYGILIITDEFIRNMHEMLKEYKEHMESPEGGNPSTDGNNTTTGLPQQQQITAIQSDLTDDTTAPAKMNAESPPTQTPAATPAPAPLNAEAPHPVSHASASDTTPKPVSDSQPSANLAAYKTQNIQQTPPPPPITNNAYIQTPRPSAPLQTPRPLPSPRSESPVSHKASATPIQPQQKRPSSTPVFRLPNAKIGQDYKEKIIVTDSSGNSVTGVWVSAVESLPAGIEFVKKEQELCGMPQIHGEHELTLTWIFNDGNPDLRVHEIKCALTVIPDPRSLWNIIEPPASMQYCRKEHTDGKLIRAASFKIAGASRRGRSHEHSGTFRDDDFFVEHNKDSGWSVIIVADGAGSAKNSRMGSKLAAEEAGHHIMTNLIGDTGKSVSEKLLAWDEDPQKAHTEIFNAFYYLYYESCKNAVQSIETEARREGLPFKAYSTTLLIAAVKREGSHTFLATFWLGDGAIAAYGPKGTVRLMGEPDSGEFAGQTRFLDAASISKEFSSRVRISRLANLTSVILMTDGVSDPRFETDNGLKDPAKWDELWDEITGALNSETPDKNLVEWLNFFTPGHHDDRTIAVLW